jgi:branched-chain amino acid transport system permease protein
MLVSLSLRRSPLYAVLLAIRDAEPFAAAAGARTSFARVAVFGLSAAMAGAAGWVFSFQGFVSPSQFGWPVSVNILVMVILGGMNTTFGPVLGAAFVTMFPVQVNISPLWQEVLFGALFVSVIILFPRGFVGLLETGGELVLRRMRPDRGRPVAAERTQAPEPLPDAAADAAAARDALARAEASGERVSANGTPAVECRGIVFGYGGGVTVLHGVDFVVRKGTIHGLIGPNGSGKSTLVDLIAGRLRPLSGTIKLDGESFERLGPAARAKHGYMRTFQAAVLVQNLPARDNVTIGLYSRVPRLAARAPLWPALPSARRDMRRMRSAASEALSFVGAGDWSETRVADVPHGIEQLTQLAAACVAEPRAVILDEPLAGLSPSEVEHAASILAELKAAGVSVILIEHQPRFVFALCDEVTVLNAGEVVATGAAADVRADQRVREVYLGR